MPAPLKIAIAAEVVGAVERFQLADPTTGVPDIGAAVDGGWVPIEFEDASPEPTKDPQRGEGVSGGCSPYKGAQSFQTYNDGVNNIPIVPGEYSIEVVAQGPGTGGDWTDTALWTMLRSRFADAGEAVAGAAGASDLVTGVSATRITPTTPVRFRVGDLGVVPSLNGRPEPFRVVDHDGTDAFISPGLPAILGVGTTVRLARSLYYLPGSEGPSIGLRLDGTGTRWFALGCRIKAISGRRDNGGRLILGLTFDVAQWIADHANADPSCADCDCLAGAVAHLTNVNPAFSDDYCGAGGGFTTAPHVAARIAGIELEDFSFEMALTTARRPSFGRPTGTCEWAASDAVIDISTKLCGRSAAFDADPGNGSATGPAKRQLIQATSPCAEATGVILWYGGVQVDSLPNDPVRGDAYWEQTISWKLDGYCGDVLGAVGGNASNTNTAFNIGFVR